MRHKPTCLWGLLAFHPKLPHAGMFPISWDPPTEPWGWEVEGGPPCSRGLDLGSGNEGRGQNEEGVHPGGAQSKP